MGAYKVSLTSSRARSSKRAPTSARFEYQCLRPTKNVLARILARQLWWILDNPWCETAFVTVERSHIAVTSSAFAGCSVDRPTATAIHWVLGDRRPDADNQHGVGTSV